MTDKEKKVQRALKAYRAACDKLRGELRKIEYANRHALGKETLRVEYTLGKLTAALCAN